LSRLHVAKQHQANEDRVLVCHSGSAEAGGILTARNDADTAGISCHVTSDATAAELTEKITSNTTGFRAVNATEDKASNTTKHVTHYNTNILSKVENGNFNEDNGFRHVDDEAGRSEEDKRLVTQWDYY
jgi:hypothetical protein